MEKRECMVIEGERVHGDWRRELWGIHEARGSIRRAVGEQGGAFHWV